MKRVALLTWLLTGILAAVASERAAMQTAAPGVQAQRPGAPGTLTAAPARRSDEGRGPFQTLVIRGAILVDGTGAPPVGPVDIVVSGNRIQSVRSAGTICQVRSSFRSIKERRGFWTMNWNTSPRPVEMGPISGVPCSERTAARASCMRSDTSCRAR